MITIHGEVASEPILANQTNLRQSLLQAVANNLTAASENYINRLKTLYSGRGNTINYVSKILTAAGSGDQELLAAAERETLLDIYTAAIEHPLADLFGKYNYRLSWVDGRLKSEFGYLDELISHGIDDKTGQVPLFEQERNRCNQELLTTLSKTRLSHDANMYKSTVVEFSPSPENLEQPEVQGRGYLGNDTISIYNLTDSGAEAVEQFWFPRLELSEYKELFRQLVELDPDNEALTTKFAALPTNPSPTDYMRLSGILSPIQLEQLRTFIDYQQAHLLQPAPLVEAYLNTTLKEQLTAQTLPLLYNLSTILTGSYTDDWVKRGLSEIFNNIAQAQFALRLFILEQTGINTFRGETAEKVKQLSWSHFQSLDSAGKNALAGIVNFVATGCGFKAVSEQTGFVHALIWGKTSSLMALLNPELFLFVCYHCGTEHEINVTAKILVDKCKGCGRTADC